MKDARKTTPRETETSVFIASRRRCCLCVFLDGKDEVVQGQIAHLNRNPADCTFENLVFLCLQHHDSYDSRTSQSKGFTEDEVRKWRSKLYERSACDDIPKPLVAGAELPELPALSIFEEARKRWPRELAYLGGPWRCSIGQTTNFMEYFAYKAWTADGVCLIERIDLPDGRIAVICIQTAGNPGTSITNAVEQVCFQVCERYDIPPHKLVWIEHYHDVGWDEWNLVSFERVPPNGGFAGPKWMQLTPELWERLGLRPKKKLHCRGYNIESKVEKLFPWPANGEE